MAESIQFEPFIPESRWMDEVDVPTQFRELSPEEQTLRLRGMAAWTIDSATEADAATETWRNAVMARIGDRALRGTNNMAFQASVGVENTFLQLVR